MFIYQAHRQERKAEKLISGKKYMEALACYEIASGLNIYIFTYNTIMFTLALYFVNIIFINIYTHRISK